MCCPLCLADGDLLAAYYRATGYADRQSGYVDEDAYRCKACGAVFSAADAELEEQVPERGA